MGKHPFFLPFLRSLRILRRVTLPPSWLSSSRDKCL
jgi:hypothetical protein